MVVVRAHTDIGLMHSIPAAWPAGHEHDMFRRLFASRGAPLNRTTGSVPRLHRRPISIQNTIERIKNPPPPVLARFPIILNAWGVLKFVGGFTLAAHVFVDYFYDYSMTWGPSMLPTLNASGDGVIISKYYRHGRGLQVGDLVSFKHALKEEVRVIKSILGTPGDFVLRDTPGQGEGVMIQVRRLHLLYFSAFG